MSGNRVIIRKQVVEVSTIPYVNKILDNISSEFAQAKRGGTLEDLEFFDSLLIEEDGEIELKKCIEILDDTAIDRYLEEDMEIDNSLIFYTKSDKIFEIKGDRDIDRIVSLGEKLEIFGENPLKHWERINILQNYKLKMKS